MGAAGHVEPSPAQLGLGFGDAPPAALLVAVLRPVTPRGSEKTDRIVEAELAQAELPLPDTTADLPRRPATRGECLPGGSNAQRPCPFVSCKYHLFLDENEGVDRDASAPFKIHFNFPGSGEPVFDPSKGPRGEWRLGDALDALEAMEETCVLDVAARGGISLEEMGEAYGFTRERARQIEESAIGKLKAQAALAALRDYCDEEPETWDARADFRAVVTP